MHTVVVTIVYAHCDGLRTYACAHCASTRIVYAHCDGLDVLSVHTVMDSTYCLCTL